MNCDVDRFGFQLIELAIALGAAQLVPHIVSIHSRQAHLQLFKGIQEGVLRQNSMVYARYVAEKLLHSAGLHKASLLETFDDFVRDVGSVALPWQHVSVGNGVGAILGERFQRIPGCSINSLSSEIVLCLVNASRSTVWLKLCIASLITLKSPL